MEIASIDKTGRLIIPARIRKKMKIDAETKFLVVNSGNRILLEKLDLTNMAERLQSELENVDIDKIVSNVREEMNERIRKEKPEIFTRQ
jgi:bifunctional DNA-binding transcriptional regulator/antitoxin component of YhaV-PrlF toxin-antitoxin module